MSQVAKFLSHHPDMGQAFREFASQYSSLAEVWANCPNSGWMLWILYKRNYRNAEKIERYIDWLREQIIGDNDEATAAHELRHTDAHKGYSEQLEEELKTGRMPEADVRFRRFISAWLTARHASDFVLNNKVADAQLNNLFTRIINAQEGIELHVPDIDEVELRLACLREQADSLRKAIGNPFTFAGANDFYYGKGMG